MLSVISFQNWGLGENAISIVIVAAIVALVLVALRQFNLAIPAWITQILWICLVAYVIIIAIRLLMSM